MLKIYFQIASASNILKLIKERLNLKLYVALNMNSIKWVTQYVQILKKVYPCKCLFPAFLRRK